MVSLESKAGNLYMWSSLLWKGYTITSKSKKLQGTRNDRKRTETRGDTDGTIILLLDPLIFDTKIPRN